ncbi:hypothetical protein NMY22_g13416 [Coprinellus aureogranulatus]|nr:hypothetical protein NMY22_g13416 [Coprinellus aureogranulatus]
MRRSHWPTRREYQNTSGARLSFLEGACVAEAGNGCGWREGGYKGRLSFSFSLSSHRFPAHLLPSPYRPSPLLPSLAPSLPCKPPGIKDAPKMSQQLTPITREAFISPHHVQTALRGENWPHSPAIMSIVSQDGKLTDVPVPAEWVERGTLPEGFAVDFLFDPEELVAKFRNAGKVYMEEIPPEMFKQTAAIVNAVNNLKIVPQFLYDTKREMIHRSVQENSTPETVMQKMRAELDAEQQPEASGSSGSGSGKKEKKKGFFKKVFGGK